MTENEKKAVISSAKTALGIEFGSTNIKAVLTALDGTVLSTGNYGWENRLEDGIWTYHLDDIWAGLAGCYGTTSGPGWPGATGILRIMSNKNIACP